MTKSALISKCAYKGVHYLDLIAQINQNGGSVSDLSFEKKNEKTIINFKSEYANGLSSFIETMIYESDVLIDWKIAPFNKNEVSIYTREEFGILI